VTSNCRQTNRWNRRNRPHHIRHFYTFPKISRGTFSTRGAMAKREML